MKFIFFGTPEFATIILEKLIKNGYKPHAVFRDPKESISVLAEKIKNLKPDMAIIAAYGKILPKSMLEIPALGFINVHPSLLPKYRGASPIQSAILNGDTETGVTIMKIDEKMDHGPILTHAKLQIAHNDNYDTLSKKLAILGANILIKNIPAYTSRKIKPTEQEHNKATYTKIIRKEDGRINWRKKAEEIERMIRAYYPWPSAWTMWSNKFLKILEADVMEKNCLPAGRQGEVFLNGSNLEIKCDKGNLIIKKLQLEGGKILSAKEFLNGHRDFIGSILE